MCIFLSFLFPLLNLNGYFPSSDGSKLFYVSGFEVQINQVIVPSVNTWTDWMGSFSGISSLVWFYTFGCFLAILKLLYRLKIIYRGLKNYYPGQAFSFFSDVHVDHELVGYSTILEHEHIHVKQFHSLDILLVELVKIINWFNPFVYLLQRSVKLNHEYLADEIVASNNKERSDYAQILLSHAFSTPVHSLANHFFNQSFIKNRIAMLFKNKSKKVVLGRFFLLIPILVVLVSFQAKETLFSTVQVLDNDDHVVVGNSQGDASENFKDVEVPAVSPGGVETLVPPVAGHDAYPQEEESGVQSSSTAALQSDSRIFMQVESPPVPVDGMPSFLRYIGVNYVYPKEAEAAKVKGRLMLAFVVEKDGTISDIKTLKDLGYGTGEEAIRVLKTSPKWKPGMQNGKLVRVEYTLPIVLDLGGGTE